MQIKPITDPAAARYGRIVTEYDMTEMQAALEKTPCPEGVVYVGSEPSLEALSVFKVFEEEIYGGMPVQLGYCNGHNRHMDAMEYHRDSEFNYAASDLILILGSREDLGEDFTYDTAKAEVFFVPKGTLIETYATTLHYAPLSAKPGEGFRMLVALPRGTNEPLTKPGSGKGEDKLRTAINKWLIAHPDAKIDGAFNGCYGENIMV